MEIAWWPAGRAGGRRRMTHGRGGGGQRASWPLAWRLPAPLLYFCMRGLLLQPPAQRVRGAEHTQPRRARTVVAAELGVGPARLGDVDHHVAQRGAVGVGHEDAVVRVQHCDLSEPGGPGARQ